MVGSFRRREFREYRIVGQRGEVGNRGYGFNVVGDWAFRNAVRSGRGGDSGDSRLVLSCLKVFAPVEKFCHLNERLEVFPRSRRGKSRFEGGSRSSGGGRRVRRALKHNQTLLLSGGESFINFVPAVAGIRIVAHATIRSGPLASFPDFGVPVVLNLVGSTSRQKLSNFRPSTNS